jgi:hypothetical protein
VLVDAFGLAPFRPAPEFGQALTNFLTGPDEETHDGLWRYCAFDLDRLLERMGERWDLIRAYNLDRARTTSLHATQQSLMEQFGMPAISPAELEGINVPTALIWGRHDLATPLSVAEAASERYGWPLRVIEGAADDPPIEQPKAFLEALDAVFERSWRDSMEADMSLKKQLETRTAWDRIAPGYDRTNTPTQMWLGNEGLSRAGLRSGMRFLDVAAGSGALSIPAARIGAQVLATDQSPIMLALLDRRARKEGSTSRPAPWTVTRLNSTTTASTWPDRSSA